MSLPCSLVSRRPSIPEFLALLPSQPSPEAMARQMFYCELPGVEALIFMKGREEEVGAQVQALNLSDYKNTYSEKCNDDLVTLLCSPAASAFVWKYWEQHHREGTPMARLQPDEKTKSVSFEPLHQLLANTGSVALAVMKALGIDAVVTMDTKLPPGVYLYSIGFDGEGVIKVGKIKIADPNAPAPAPGKGHGTSKFYTVADRFKGHLGTLALPMDFKGPCTVEKMELLHLVPAVHEEFNERWVQCKLRSYAQQPTDVQPPYLQCKTKGKTGKLGTSEFFDARLAPLAMKYMKEVAISPDQCRKAVRVALEWDDGDSSPAEEAQRERAPPALQEPGLPSSLPAVAAGPKPISAPYKCKIVWELENGKTKDRGFLLTPAQIVSKNRMVVQFFEALGKPDHYTEAHAKFHESVKQCLAEHDTGLGDGALIIDALADSKHLQVECKDEILQALSDRTMGRVPPTANPTEKLNALRIQQRQLQNEVNTIKAQVQEEKLSKAKAFADTTLQAVAAVELGGASPEDYAAVIKANQLARKKALREQAPAAEAPPKKKRGAKKAAPEAEVVPEEPLEEQVAPEAEAEQVAPEAEAEQVADS